MSEVITEWGPTARATTFDVVEGVGCPATHALVGVVQGGNECRHGGAGLGTEVAENHGGLLSRMDIGVTEGGDHGRDNAAVVATENAQGCGRALPHIVVDLFEFGDLVSNRGIDNAGWDSHVDLLNGSSGLWLGKSPALEEIGWGIAAT
jgi:hypothetical protein